MHTQKLRGMILFVVVILGVSAVFAGTDGVRKKRVLPHDYGNVVMNNFSQKNNIAPVMFNHWLHRAKYTCRLCHVDLGFAMQANATRMREEDNKKGFYCGACHNETEAFGNESWRPFGEKTKNCDRCHSVEKNVIFEKDFYTFTAKLPRERFGNWIDWERAENEGMITLKDYLEGISVKKKPLNIPKDSEVKPKAECMPDILFSHRKHTAWSGCELCHPDIFDVKKDGTKYSMSDIFAGKYCGLCHGRVSFPNADCQRCHTKEI